MKSRLVPRSLSKGVLIRR